jgi:hypothetical protein
MPPTGCLTVINTTIPRPTFAPFTTKNGSNEHFAKTNRPLSCCLQNCLESPFYMGLAPAQNATTRIGSGQLTPCGRTSAIATRRQPTNAIMTSKLLAKNRRPLTANTSLMSVPPTNARRLPARRLHAVSAFLTRRPRLMAKHTALAQQMAAAQTIFLWLCCRCLHVRLARQTLR